MVLIQTWTGDGADNLATTAGNWDSNTVPQAGDYLVWDGVTGGSPNKDCTFDLLIDSRTFTTEATFSGTITFNYDHHCLGALSHRGGHIIASGKYLTVDGAWVQPSGSSSFEQDNSAGSGLWVKYSFTNDSISGSNQFDSENIKLGSPDAGHIFEVVNTDFQSRMNVILISGNTYKATGRLYWDKINSIEGNGFITMTNSSGQKRLIPNNYNNGIMERIIWAPEGTNGLLLALLGPQDATTVDFAGCELECSGIDTVAGTNWSNIGALDLWKTNGASFSLDGVIECEDCYVGNSGVTNRTGNVTLLGTLRVSDRTYLAPDDGILVTRLDVSGADEFTTGRLEVDDEAEFDSNGLAEFSVGSSTSGNDGNITMSSVNTTVDMTGTTVRLVGTNDCTVTWPSSPANISEEKTNAAVVYDDAFTLSGVWKQRNTNGSSKLNQANSYTADSINWLNGGTSVDSVDGSTQVTLNLTTVGPYIKGTNVSNIGVAGITQNADSFSSTDGGGNANISFGAIPGHGDGIEKSRLVTANVSQAVAKAYNDEPWN